MPVAGQGGCALEIQVAVPLPRFTLPDAVDAASVTAQGANGVLEVVIPKQPNAEPRRIAIVPG